MCQVLQCCNIIDKLIEYNNYQIIPTEEAFLIAPIRKLYNSDKTKNKEKFMQLLSVIYF